MYKRSKNNLQMHWDFIVLDMLCLDPCQVNRDRSSTGGNKNLKGFSLLRPFPVFLKCNSFCFHDKSPFYLSTYDFKTSKRTCPYPLTWRAQSQKSIV